VLAPSRKLRRGIGLSLAVSVVGLDLSADIGETSLEVEQALLSSPDFFQD
jgi:hypothetical protein